MSLIGNIQGGSNQFDGRLKRGSRQIEQATTRSGSRAIDDFGYFPRFPGSLETVNSLQRSVLQN
jgi:hypothetical protein